MKHRGRILLVAIVYIFVGEASEHIATQAADISAFWPPAGIGLAAILLYGPKILPALILGAAAGNLFDVGLGLSLGFPKWNGGLFIVSAIDVGTAVVEAVIGWTLISRFQGTPDPFKRVRHAGVFIIGAAGFAPAVTAFLGALALQATGAATIDKFGAFWLTWATGDAVGILAITPLLIAWHNARLSEARLKWCGEMAIIFVAVLLIAQQVARNVPLEYLVLLPLIWASLRLGLRGATVVVLLTSLTSLAIDLESPDNYFGRFDSVVGVLLVQSFVGSVAMIPLVLIPTLAEKRAVSEQQARLQRDLQIARSIQQGLLPGEAPELPGFDIAGWSNPADETGGDYYDWITCDDGRLIIMLGDVTGHGIGPALVTVAARAYGRAAIQAKPRLGELLTWTNKLLAEDLTHGRFITLAAVAIDPASNKIELRSAGHGPICIYRAKEHVVQIRGADDLPLGIVDDLVYGDPIDIELNAGDMLVLVTDGFTEWPNGDQEMFGNERLEKSLLSSAGRKARQVISNLAFDVNEHASGARQPDDLTAVVIRRIDPKVSRS